MDSLEGRNVVQDGVSFDKLIYTHCNSRVFSHAVYHYPIPLCEPDLSGLPKKIASKLMRSCQATLRYPECNNDFVTQLHHRHGYAQVST